MVSAIDSESVDSGLELSQSKDVVGIDVSSANENYSISDTQKSIYSNSYLNSSNVKVCQNSDLGSPKSEIISSDEISIQSNNADILSASDDGEILKDYNTDFWDGQYWYYDDSISGGVLTADTTRTYNVGDTITLKLGSEVTNYDYGGSPCYIRMDGELNTSKWVYVGTYEQLIQGVDYTLTIPGNHYLQVIFESIYAYDGGGRRFSKGVGIYGIGGINSSSYYRIYESDNPDNSTLYYSGSSAILNLYNAAYDRLYPYSNSSRYLEAAGVQADVYVDGVKVGTTAAGYETGSYESSLTTPYRLSLTEGRHTIQFKYPEVNWQSDEIDWTTFTYPSFHISAMDSNNLTVIVGESPVEETIGITVVADNVVYGETATAKILANVTGTYEVFVDGMSKGTVELTANKQTEFDLGRYDAGENYNVTVTSRVDNYAVVSDSDLFNVSKAGSQIIKVTNATVDYDADVVVNVTAENATGIKVTVYNGTTVIYTTDDVAITPKGDNDFTVVISGLKEGNYTIDVVTVPDSNHNVSEVKTGNIEVCPVVALEITKEVSDGIKNVEIGQTITYKISVTNNGPSVATGVTVLEHLSPLVEFVSASADKGTYNESSNVWTIQELVKDGKSVLNIVVKVIKEGTVENSVTVTSNENDTEISANSDNVTVSKEEGSGFAANATPDEIPIGNSTLLNSTVTNENATGKVIYHLDNGTNVTCDIGEVYEYTPDTVGEHIVNVTYTGDDNFEGAETTITVKVNKINLKLTAYADPIEFYIGEATNLVAFVDKDDATGNVTFYDNEGNFIAEVTLIGAKDGKLGYAVSRTHLGDNYADDVSYTPEKTGLQNKLKAVYSGDSKYLPAESTLEINVLKKNEQDVPVDDSSDAVNDSSDGSDDAVDDSDDAVDDSDDAADDSSDDVDDSAEDIDDSGDDSSDDITEVNANVQHSQSLLSKYPTGNPIAMILFALGILIFKPLRRRD